MKGLLYGVAPTGQAEPDSVPELQALANTPMDLVELDDPKVLADDWVVLKTRLCGICGSDTKQVFMDGEVDNAMTALISFPQVLGHEVVADVVEVGAKAGVAVGQRVVLNPWLSCGPRGIDPVCAACERGDFSLCGSFADGRLPPGIHTGNSSTATGGFAEFLPAHDSMCIPVPDDITDEVAVLADPFSVSMHAILRSPPPAGGTALVYGVGTLGSLAISALRTLHPQTPIFAVARYPHQADLASDLGAEPIGHQPAEDIISWVAEATRAPTRTPLAGLRWLYPGGVDVIYDTVGSPETLEVGVRIARARATIAITGVATPGRFEWTPWYFKELALVGSNAFGNETLDGVRKHALSHYLDLVGAGRTQVDGVLTHTFGLPAWREAFSALAQPERSHAVKIAFDLR